MSAGLRRCLDAVIPAPLQQGAIDAEVVEAIIDAATVEFKQFSMETTPATALRTMIVTDRARLENNWVKNDFAGLRPQSQRRCEAALSELSKQGKSVRAHMVFDALATALECTRTVKNDRTILIARYVEALAAIWKAAGLHPSRAGDPANPEYKSKFHRFSDLVLTAVAEPWSRRHDSDRDHLQKMANTARMKLPQEYRQSSATLAQSDTGWLVSEQILRKGLRLKK